MQSDWELSKTTSLPDDELLACLLLVSKFYKNPCSASALITGLPLEENRLVPSVFERAANRAGLTSKIVKRELTNISKLTLPAILLLKDKRACILTDIDESFANVILMPMSEGKTKIKLTELAKDYLGSVIFIRPQHEKPKRGEEIIAPEKGHWLWSIFFKAIPIYNEVIVASVLINLFALAVPLFLRIVYNKVLPNSAFETLWVLVSGLAIIFVFDFILKSLRANFIDHASRTIDIRLSSIIFSHVLGIKMAARPTSIGAFANSIQSFEFFRDFITSTTLTVLVDIPFFFLFVAALFYIGGVGIGIIPLIMMPIILIVGVIVHVPLSNLTKQSYSYNAEKNAVLYESLSGIESIKTETAESHMQSRWERVIGLAANLGNRLRLVSNFFMNFSTLARQITTVLIIIVAVYKVDSGDLSTGGLIAAIIIGSRAMVPITQAALVLTKYFQAKSALEALNKIMQLPGEREEATKKLHIPEIKGSIELKNISFSYQADTPTVIKNVSLKIRPGEHVGIIGRLGSGKTTLAKLILGLYQAQEGSVLLDDIEINQLDLVDVRRNIAYVPQDINLFNTTIRENIILGQSEADDSDILKALEISGVNRFTKIHPQGLDREVGENGKFMSGGQRQAIVLARALMGNPKIFILDEPTNSMDDNSEQYIINQLQRHCADKTLILITHRASMLRLVDRLIVTDQGKLLIDGNKEKVMEVMKRKTK